MEEKREVKKKESKLQCVSQRKESPSLVPLKNGNYEISALSGPIASTAEITRAVYRLQTCFPSMDDGFFRILSERIEKSGMSSKRLEYAVNKVIDTFTYKTLTIADILSIDVTRRAVTYETMCNEIAKNGGSTDMYESVRVEGMLKPLWIKKL